MDTQPWAIPLVCWDATPSVAMECSTEGFACGIRALMGLAKDHLPSRRQTWTAMTAPAKYRDANNRCLWDIPTRAISWQVWTHFHIGSCWMLHLQKSKTLLPTSSPVSKALGSFFVHWCLTTIPSHRGHLSNSSTLYLQINCRSTAPPNWRIEPEPVLSEQRP